MPGARPPPRSRWGSSWPAKVAASTAAPPPARSRTRPRHDRAPAARRRGAHHRGQHPDRQRRLEGVPRPALRQRRGAQAVRGHSRSPPGPLPGWRARPAFPPACSTWCTASARRRARRWSSRPRWTSSASPAPPRWGATSSRAAGARLAKVCLELGGKNPLIVCDDADLDLAANRGGPLGVQQRRPALRRGQPDHRVRRGLRPLPRPLLRGASPKLRVGSGDERRLRAGDQREAAAERCCAAVEAARQRWRHGADRRATV